MTWICIRPKNSHFARYFFPPPFFPSFSSLPARPRRVTRFVRALAAPVAATRSAHVRRETRNNRALPGWRARDALQLLSFERSKPRPNEPSRGLAPLLFLISGCTENVAASFYLSRRERHVRPRGEEVRGGATRALHPAFLRVLLCVRRLGYSASRRALFIFRCPRELLLHVVPAALLSAALFNADVRQRLFVVREELCSFSRDL